MPMTLPAMELAVDGGIPDGTYQVMLLDTLGESIGLNSGNVTPGQPDIDALANSLVVNSGVRFATTGTLYSPLAVNTAYRVVNKGPADLIQIARIPSGTPITLTNAGVGTHTLINLEPVETVGGEQITAFDLDDLVRFEITNYPGNLRPETAITGVETRADAKFKTAVVTVDNSAGVSVIEFRYLAFVYSGSTTPGDVTGSCRATVIASPFPIQVPAGEQRAVTANLVLGPC